MNVPHRRRNWCANSQFKKSKTRSIGCKRAREKDAYIRNLQS